MERKRKLSSDGGEAELRQPKQTQNALDDVAGVSPNESTNSMYDKYKSSAGKPNENPLKKYTRIFYYENSNDKNEELLKSDPGKEMMKNYFKWVRSAQENRKKNNICEPAKWAVLAMLDVIKGDYNKENCDKKTFFVADFGCGELQFAKLLIEEVKKDEFFQNIIFNCVCYDYSTNPIKELKDLPKNITIKIKLGVNCAKPIGIKPLEFDYVISTCALFGNYDTCKPILLTAFDVLKENGVLFLAEKRMGNDDCGLPSEIKECIKAAGVGVSNYKLDVELKEKFNDEFVAAKLKKTANYKFEKLIPSLAKIHRNKTYQSKFP